MVLVSRSSSNPRVNTFISANTLVHSPVNRALFFTQLAQWARCVTYGGLKDIAVRRIQYVYETNHVNLDLSLLALTDLPDLSALHGLRELDLSENRLSKLPDLSKIPTLERLDLSCNQFAEMPDVSELKNVRDLNMSHNRLTVLTDISVLTQLRELDLSNNQLAQVPVLSKLTGLNRLLISSNQLTCLPDISALRQLKLLNAGNNRLTNLPDFNALDQLEVLYLGHNQLTHISDISALTNLRLLNLRNNQLTTLPSFATLARLLILDISNNFLVERPRNLNLLRLSFEYSARGNFFEINDAKTEVIDLYDAEQYNPLLHYVCDHITADKNWVLFNTSCINQLLYQASFLSAITRNVRTVEDDANLLLAKNIRDQFFSVDLIAECAERTKAIVELDAQEGEGLVFVSEDGQQGLSMTKSCYEKNILGLNVSPLSEYAQWSNGVLVHRCDPDMGLVYLDKLHGYQQDLAPFPLLLKCYEAMQAQHCMHSVLTQLNLGEYQYQFTYALSANVVRDSSKKLIGPEHVEPLNAIFYPLITTQSDGEPVITHAHGENLFTQLTVLEQAPEKQAALLFCLSTVFVKYSSSSSLGSEHESPFAVRRYAAALLTKAVQLYPDLIPIADANDYKNRLLGRREQRERTVTFGCADTLVDNMMTYARRQGSEVMQAMFDHIFPQAWR